MSTASTTILSHHGIKGMRWGFRKAEDSSSSTPLQDLKPHGVTIGKDGSITMEKGANLQRLVRSNGKSMPMKDITYASINAYDNAKYIKVIGGKGFFGGGRDTILSIQTTQKITAPSTKESTRIVSDLMIHDAEFRKHNTDILGRTIAPKDMQKIIADPVGKTAQIVYSSTNQKLTFGKDFDSSAPLVQKRVREEFQKRGYNAVRDENDIGSKIAKAPIIIFSPEKSLKVVKTTEITDKIRKANKETLKRYKKNGKGWVDRELYAA
jgi:hypothetical protein